MSCTAYLDVDDVFEIYEELIGPTSEQAHTRMSNA
jgi:hypothetical protein